LNNLKRRIRKLKRLEIQIRFQGAARSGAVLAWDDLFDLHNTPTGKAKYSLVALSTLSQEEYKHIVDEFFARVYFELYKESGIAPDHVFDPGVLALLDLPFNADGQDIKKRFRELAKKHHPDAGGDASRFIELMDAYRKLSAD